MVEHWKRVLFRFYLCRLPEVSNHILHLGVLFILLNEYFSFSIQSKDTQSGYFGQPGPELICFKRSINWIMANRIKIHRENMLGKSSADVFNFASITTYF